MKSYEMCKIAVSGLFTRLYLYDYKLKQTHKATREAQLSDAVLANTLNNASSTKPMN